MAIGAGITIDEYELLPAALARNHELVDGELVDVSGNTPEHNFLRDLLVVLLTPIVSEHKLGRVISEQEFDFDGNAHGPDVALIGAAKVHLLDSKKRVQRFVPDFAVEVVSANDTFNSLIAKAARYRKCGTKEVWVLSQDRRCAFVLSEDRKVILEDDQILESKLLPGFSVVLSELFDRV